MLISIRRTWPVGCTIVCFALALSGCPTTGGGAGGRDGLSVGNANRSLTDLVNDLAQAKARNDPLRIGEVTANLRSLGEAAQGSARVEPNPLNRIALCRIATTAAWQASDDRVAQYANLGSTLCEEHAANAPRDCSMLTVVPVLAAAAQSTQRLNAVQRMPRVTEDERAQVLAEVQVVFGEFADELALAFQSRPQIAGSNTDPGVLAAIDTNIEALLCETVEIKTFGVVATVSDAVTDTLCRIGRLKEQAKTAGLTSEEIGCLDTGATVAACE